jgi:Prealbumin-like fold domain
VSDSCSQRAANNINNGVPRTSGAAAPNTGTLIVNKVCVDVPGGASCQGSFNLRVTGTNPQASSSFSLSNGGSHSVALGAGAFTVSEDSVSGFTTSFAGDCMQTTSGSQEATGTIAAGQHLTCTITNTAVPATGTLTVNKVCVEPSNPGDCERTGTGDFNVRITGNNPNPPGFSLRGGESQDITLGSGSFTITETTTFPFTTFSGDCMLASSPGPFQVAATGTIAAGQHLTCTITNSAL